MALNTRTVVKDPDNDQQTSGVAKNFEERLSKELVFALVGPLGSGVSKTANLLRERLTGPFKYTCPEILKPSDVIREQAALLSQKAPDIENGASYVDKMQDLGNDLRNKFGNNYLVEKVIEKIQNFRWRL